MTDLEKTAVLADELHARRVAQALEEREIPYILFGMET